MAAGVAVGYWFLFGYPAVKMEPDLSPATTVTLMPCGMKPERSFPETCKGSCVYGEGKLVGAKFFGIWPITSKQIEIIAIKG